MQQPNQGRSAKSATKPHYTDNDDDDDNNNNNETKKKNPIAHVRYRPASRPELSSLSISRPDFLGRLLEAKALGDPPQMQLPHVENVTNSLGHRRVRANKRQESAVRGAGKRVAVSGESLHLLVGLQVRDRYDTIRYAGASIERPMRTSIHPSIEYAHDSKRREKRIINECETNKQQTHLPPGHLDSDKLHFNFVLAQVVGVHRLVGLQDQQRLAVQPRAGSPADSVDVIDHAAGRIVVDDQLHAPRKVEAPRGDVRRDEDRGGRGQPELPKRLHKHQGGRGTGGRRKERNEIVTREGLWIAP